MDLHYVVMKLVGSVHPVGETHEDEKRLKNMKELTELVEHLLFEIGSAAHLANKQEASVKAVGIHARNFMNEVRQSV